MAGSKKTTLSASFAHFDAKPTNPRWSWSAVSDDGKTVVITLWRDFFDYSQKPPLYVDPTLCYEDWRKRPGNRQRINHLRFAAENCNGYFRGVITVALDPLARTRKIADCYPFVGAWMRLISLDEESGVWSAVVEHRD